MRISIRGRRWSMVWQRLSGKDGECSHPLKKHRTIALNPRIKRSSQRYMEVVIHECLHAANWDLDEECVDEYAHDVARILHRLGFRLDDGSQT